MDTIHLLPFAALANFCQLILDSRFRSMHNSGLFGLTGFCRIEGIGLSWVMGEEAMKHYLSGFLLTIVLALPCLADEVENVRIATAMMDAINARDLDALDELIAPNVLRHSAATAGVVVTNLSEFKAFLETDFATVSDSIQKIDVIFGGGDYVAVRARYIGTQDGPMGPFPASGKRLELPYNGILRFEDDKVVEIWVEWDNLFALTQLGHFPPPPD